MLTSNPFYAQLRAVIKPISPHPRTDTYSPFLHSDIANVAAYSAVAGANEIPAPPWP